MVLSCKYCHMNHLNHLDIILPKLVRFLYNLLSLPFIQAEYAQALLVPLSLFNFEGIPDIFISKQRRGKFTPEESLSGVIFFCMNYCLKTYSSSIVSNRGGLPQTWTGHSTINKHFSLGISGSLLLTFWAWTCLFLNLAFNSNFRCKWIFLGGRE